ncbi:hypothetical protein C8Q80DRAFT_1215062, partial [Daedaleopsis nitida]
WSKSKKPENVPGHRWLAARHVRSSSFLSFPPLLSAPVVPPASCSCHPSIEARTFRSRHHCSGHKALHTELVRDLRRSLPTLEVLRRQNLGHTACRTVLATPQRLPAYRSSIPAAAERTYGPLTFHMFRARNYFSSRFPERPRGFAQSTERESVRDVWESRNEYMRGPSSRIARTRVPPVRSVMARRVPSGRAHTRHAGSRTAELARRTREKESLELSRTWTQSRALRTRSV